MFMLLSIPDIGVGVLSMTALGVYYSFTDTLRHYYKHGIKVPLIIELLHQFSLHVFHDTHRNHR